MTQQIDDGGPAFPVDEIDVAGGHYEGRYEVQRQHPGMSLLDWFAGQAIVGMLPTLKARSEESLVSEAIPKAAEFAYKIARAMIAEAKNQRNPE